MLTRVEIQGFKALQRVSVVLEPFTVFVGGNASGKTSLLEALDLLSHLAFPHPDERTDGRGRVGLRLVHDFPLAEFRHPAVPRLSVGVTATDGAWTLLAEPGDAVQTPHWRIDASRDGQQATLSFPPPLGAPDVARPDYAPWAPLGRLRLLADRATFYGERVPVENRSIDPAQESEPITILHHLAGSRDPRLDQIEAMVRKIVPSFRSLSFAIVPGTRRRRVPIRVDGAESSTTLTEPAPNVEMRVRFDGDLTFPAWHASEGTRLALALSTHAVVAGPHATLLIDDLDAGLHPVAQHNLVDGIRQIQAARPDVQVLATTHSLDLLNACRAEEIRVIGVDPERGPTIRGLLDHPEAADWLRTLRPGELWSYLGEDWIRAATAP